MDELSSIKRGRLTPLHLVIIFLSLLMTLAAWQFSKQQIETQIQVRFQQDRDQVVGLLRERMRKYEDALWSGVSALQSHGGDISYGAWREFSRTLRIERKYRGINGIGVIHFLTPAEVPEYLAKRRAERPDFRIHPEHGEEILMPISFIEPVVINAQAVGLDVAHEQNRREAALASHTSGEARITGPITLVQDAGNTPGFLFYAPFGNAREVLSADDTAPPAKGAVYAPFVVRKLMEGLLAKEVRNTRFSIVDDGQVIYDEHAAQDDVNDPDPMFSETVTVEMYGRSWVLDLRTNLGFREDNQSTQPTFILAGGLLIEGLIIALLVMMSRANHRAVAYAGKVTATLLEKSETLTQTNVGLADAQRELKVKNTELEAKNVRIEDSRQKLSQALHQSEELRREQADFTYAVSHDLKSPANTLDLILKELATEQHGKLDAENRELLELAQATTSRMSELIVDILNYSWATNEGSDFEWIDMKECLNMVMKDLAYDVSRTGAVVKAETLDPVHGSRTQIRMLLQNLISNGIKFQQPGTTPTITVESRAAPDQKSVRISVKDNGIGIAEEFHDRIFGLFQRLHGQEIYPGTGLGLTTCNRIALNHNGRLSMQSVLGEGSTFVAQLPTTETDRGPQQSGETVSAFKPV